MTDLLIKNGRVLDPASGRDEKVDVAIQSGRITSVAASLAARDARHVIDAEGCWLTPGLVELSCESGEPGREDRETFATLLAAAARGGFTHVAIEPNTAPVHDEAAVTTHLLSLATASGEAPLPYVLPLGALSRGLHAEEQTNAGELRRAGAVALSDGGLARGTFDFLRRALEYADSHDLPVHMSACRELRANEGVSAARLGIKGQPARDELANVQQGCALAELTGAYVHISGISLPASARALTECSARISAAIAVCNLFDDDSLLADYDPTSKLLPPLRAAADRDALVHALVTSEADARLCLSARHRPRTQTEQTTTFDEAVGGRSSLEVAVARSLRLVHEHGISPLRWASLWTLGPAQALAQQAPSIRANAPANLTIVDPAHKWTPTPNELRSRSRNLPSTTGTLQGRVTHTIVNGGIAFEL